MAGLLTPNDVQSLRVEVVGQLALPDPYRVKRSVLVSTDSRGNPTYGDVIVEAGEGKLDARATLTPSERVIADAAGWSTPVAINLPANTGVINQDRVMIGNRTFEVGGIQRGGASAMTVRVVAEERSH